MEQETNGQDFQMDEEAPNESAEDPTVDEIELDEEEIQKLAGVVEALIFVSGDPVPLRRLCDILEKKPEEVNAAIEALSARYSGSASAIQVMEVAGGFQLRTNPAYREHVNKFLERKRKQTLSGAALEAIAIVAYKQPITRAEIEAIRGVGVDGVLKSLLDKRLIKVAGVKEVPGRPNLYGTTKKFLEYFSINTLKDLPAIEDISETFPSQAAGLVEIDESEEGAEGLGQNAQTPEAETQESADLENAGATSEENADSNK